MSSRKNSVLEERYHQEALFDPRRINPDYPGYKRPGTSKEAAKAIAPSAGALREAVLAELARASGTADEIAERLGQSILSIRPRLSELSERIEPTGERRPNQSGKMANVWRLKR